MHIEDQVGAKRCGHRPGKEVVPADEMVDRVKAAVDARTDEHFVIMARTDALRASKARCAIERARRYVEAGADMIFAEACTDSTTIAASRRGERAGAREHHRVRQDAALHSRRAESVGVDIVLYRCRAFRAMNAAALKRLHSHPPRRHAEDRRRHDADARRISTRYLGYHAYEQQLDAAVRRTKVTEKIMSEADNSLPQTSAFKPKKSVALSGVTAGNTALCTVGRTGNDLHYRGYDILDVASTCEFEEIAYLLVHGKLPNAAELTAYKTKLKASAWPAREPEGGARAAAGVGASDGRDAHRRLSARLRAARERGSQRRGRERYRRPPDGLARLDAAATGITSRTTACASKSKPTTIPIGGHFLHLLHGAPVQAAGSRDAHVAQSLCRA